MAGSQACITVREAADALGCSPSTVRQMFHSGKLSGVVGPQPHRPRILIHADNEGRPLDGELLPIGDGSLRSRLDGLENRLRDLEMVSDVEAKAERFRDAALLLQGVVERQRRSSELHAQALQELEAALAEQSQIILTLLVDDQDIASASATTR